MSSMYQNNKQKIMFHGSIVALVTPFKNNEIDDDKLRELVEWHIEAGTHGIVVNGTTGEAATLTAKEQLHLVKTVVNQVKERIPVIAGTASQSTEQCIKLTLAAVELGVHAVLIMTPAYIKPTQNGLILHYQAIAEKVPVPIILYNVPSRTACDMLPETVAILSQKPNIVAIKEATGNMSRLKEILKLCNGRLDVLSGDDSTACDWMEHGAKGVISVTANVAPTLMAKLCDATLDQDFTLAKKYNDSLNLLNKLLFVESNPIPVKWALSKMGRISPEIRLPLTELSEVYQKDLADTLTSLNLA